MTSLFFESAFIKKTFYHIILQACFLSRDVLAFTSFTTM